MIILDDWPSFVETRNTLDEAAKETSRLVREGVIISAYDMLKFRMAILKEEDAWKNFKGRWDLFEEDFRRGNS